MKHSLLLVFLSIMFIQCESDQDECSIPATVRDLTGFDGCGIVLELEDGSRLEPERIFRCGTPPQAKELDENPLLDFEFYDGQRVLISYEETNRPSICMVGPTVKITCIREISTITTD